MKLSAVLLAIVALTSTTIAGAERSEPSKLPAIDKLVVLKEARELSLLSEGRVVKSYSIALGAQPRGHKEQEGDERTPEGLYAISSKNPESAYHLSLRVSYPSSDDVRRAREKGVSPGGDIMIHGLPNGLGWLGPIHRLFDWTDGCIAVTNGEIDEIWELVRVGTPISIEP